MNKKEKEMLRTQISDTFDEKELHMLCFDLDIGQENLVDDTKAELIMSLIRYCERRGQTQALINKLSELRPHIVWPQPDARRSELEPHTGATSATEKSRSYLPDDLKQIETQIEQGETWLAMAQLRNMIAIHLQQIASQQQIAIKDVPPMHLLQALEEAHHPSRETAVQLEYALSVASTAVNGVAVSQEEAVKALEAVANGLQLSEQESQFEIRPAANGKFVFVLKDSLGQSVLASESYGNKRSIPYHIEILKVNLQRKDRIRRQITKNGRHFFTVVAPNGQIIGLSDFYDSLPILEESLLSIKNFVDDAPSVDFTENPG